MRAEQRLTQAFLDAHPDDAAAILESSERSAVAALLEELPPESAAVVCQRLTPTHSTACLEATAAEPVSRIIQAMPLRAAARLLRRMEAQKRTHLLAPLPADLQRALGLILHYPEGTAGAWMDPHIMTLRHDVTVGEALRQLRRASTPTLSYLYIVDDSHRLVGVASLSDLMRRKPGEAVRATMATQVVRVAADADVTTLLNHPGWRTYHKLPVVDPAGQLVGVIRYKTLRRLEERPPGPDWGWQALSLALLVGETYWLTAAAVINTERAAAAQLFDSLLADKGAHHAR